MENYTCEIEGKIFKKGRPCLYERNGTISGNPTCPQCEYYKNHLIPTQIEIPIPRKRITSKSFKKKNLTHPKEDINITQRARFRLQCIKRTPLFKDLSERIKEMNENKICQKDLMEYVLNNFNQCDGLTCLFLTAVCIKGRLDENDSVYYFADFPSIEVLTDPNTFVLKLLKPINKLKEEMSAFRSYRDLEFGWKPTIEESNTISIKINLNRRKSDIIGDVTNLLDTLKKYGKYRDPDYRLPLEDFEKYFKAYDLKEERKSWSKIAHNVFPREKDKENAKRLVRYYYKQVDKWIREEVWRR
ncbi:MAG: hypothetical protein FJ130_05195 [Deltaproteobacteria bacterium]|nr:hypothetical protein [Deltaproteobacteria bacterium]